MKKKKKSAFGCISINLEGENELSVLYPKRSSIYFRQFTEGFVAFGCLQRYSTWTVHHLHHFQYNCAPSSSRSVFHSLKSERPLLQVYIQNRDLKGALGTRNQKTCRLTKVLRFVYVPVSVRADVLPQLCRCQSCNAARQSISLADGSSALLCPRHNISASQLLSVHFPLLHLQFFLERAKVLQRARTPLSLHTQNKTWLCDIWNLKAHANICMWETD